MDAHIRPYQPQDEEPVVELSLRAWAPVFESVNQVLGRELSRRLHGDWRDHQARAVRDTLANSAATVWVAQVGNGVAGFVAATLHREPSMGEIWMLAVDPEHQEVGVGTAL